MITIMKASAGSGKTWNLAARYIECLFRSDDPRAYRHILAVTFTNKATDEMKRRILKELYVLSTAPSSSGYFSRLVPDICPTEEILRARAEKHLCAILHDYSAFAVSTIDRFFQQTLRAFSREIGQFSSYQVELDRKSLVRESVARILDSITENDRKLIDWLTGSVMDNLEQGKRFNLESQLEEIAVKLKSEDYRSIVEKYGIDEEKVYSRDNLRAVKEECYKIIREFKVDVRDRATAVLDTLKRAGVEPEQFYKGFLKNTLYTYAEITSSDSVEAPSDKFVKRISDPDQWFAKANARLLPLVDGVLQGPMEDLLALFNERFKAYNTAVILKGQIYGLGIAGELNREFAALMKEKNVLCLDDSNAILRNIIDGSDAPFVYEKLGVRYEDFLLDEFQDTSTIQWENFRPLLVNSESQGNSHNLIVGDVKQSIYRWRGSDWGLLDSRLPEEFPRGEVVSLQDNYRTLRKIVEFNNGFFTYAASELDKLFDTTEGERKVADIYADVTQTPKVKDDAPGSVDVVFCKKEEILDRVAAGVQSVIDAGGGYGDVAVLVRGNGEGAKIASDLIARGIPVVSDESLMVKSSLTVRRMVSLMTLADNREDKVGGYLASSLGVEVPEGYHSLNDLAEAVVRELRKTDEVAVDGDVLYIQSFMDVLQDWSATGGNNLAAFLRYWKDADPKISSPAVESSVRIMTVHKSKGLEFPYVIFPYAENVELYKADDHWCRPAAEGSELEGVADGVFKVKLTDISKRSLFAEDYRRERRLQGIDNINVFYVALTRPQKGILVISEKPSAKLVTALERGDTPGWGSMSDLLYGYVREHLGGGEEFSIGQMYDFSAISRDVSGEERIESRYPSYGLNEGGDRLVFRTTGAEFFGDDGSVGAAASPRLRGSVLHEILASVVGSEDLPGAVSRAVRDGLLSQAEGDEALGFLEEALASVEERHWFDNEGAEVLNETSLIDVDGSVYRPDRVIVRDGVVTVLDYKFGVHDGSEESLALERKYWRQVSRYASLYERMGYVRVEKYLWYVTEGVILPGNC